MRAGVRRTPGPFRGLSAAAWSDRAGATAPLPIRTGIMRGSCAARRTAGRRPERCARRSARPVSGRRLLAGLLTHFEYGDAPAAVPQLPEHRQEGGSVVLAHDTARLDGLLVDHTRAHSGDQDPAVRPVTSCCTQPTGQGSTPGEDFFDLRGDEPRERTLGPDVTHDLHGVPSDLFDHPLDGGRVEDGQARGRGTRCCGTLIGGRDEFAGEEIWARPMSTCRGSMWSGSVPIPSPLTSWRTGQREDMASGSSRPGPRSSSVMLHRLSPGRTSTVDGEDGGGASVTAGAPASEGGTGSSGVSADPEPGQPRAGRPGT